MHNIVQLLYEERLDQHKLTKFGDCKEKRLDGDKTKRRIKESKQVGYSD